MGHVTHCAGWAECHKKSSAERNDNPEFQHLDRRKLYRPDSFGGYAKDITAPNTAAEDAISRARAAYPQLDCVVPLTHQNFKDDKELAEQLAGKVPCLLGGHDHDGKKSSVLASPHQIRSGPRTAQYMRNAASHHHGIHTSPLPQRQVGGEGGVHIVKADESAADVCVVDLVWQVGSTALPTCSVRRVRLEKKEGDTKKGTVEEPAAFEPDGALKRMCDEKNKTVSDLSRVVLLRTKASQLASECMKPAVQFTQEVSGAIPEELAAETVLTSKAARVRECSIATLLATALCRGAMLGGGVTGPNGPIESCDGALINGGSVRAGRDYPEDFTFANLMDEVTLLMESMEALFVCGGRKRCSCVVAVSAGGVWWT